MIDGCIQWLMGAGEGGMFRSIYDDLGILREVDLQPIDLFHRCEDPTNERVVELRCDLGRYREDLLRLSPGDAEEIDRLLDAAAASRELPMPMSQPPELATPLDRLRTIWDARHLFCTSAAPSASGLSALCAARRCVHTLRPRGGSGVFRDALVWRFRELGGRASINATVDEVLIEEDRAIGVRLTDGGELRARIVVSSASAHEKHLRLLGGRYLDRSTRKRLDEWPTFEPIVMMNAGVEMDLSDVPDTLIVRQREALVIGGRSNSDLSIRIYQGDPAFAPPGHHVVQAILPTTYDWWATRGADYPSEKEHAVEAIIARIDERLPDWQIRAA